MTTETPNSDPSNPSREQRALAFMQPPEDGGALWRTADLLAGGDRTKLAAALVEAGAAPELANRLATMLIFFADDRARSMDEIDAANARIAELEFTQYEADRLGDAGPRQIERGRNGRDG